MNDTINRIGALQIVIIAATLATAFIHLGLAIFLPDPLFTPLFILNGIGYITLLIAYFLPRMIGYRNLIRWLLIAFAGVTILAYLIANLGNYSAFGLVDKGIEVVLIVALYIDGRTG
jgi:hypothetical protein